MRMHILALVVFIAFPAWAAEKKCDSLNVTVTYKTKADASNACAGVAIAANFMAEHGFNTKVSFSIRVVDNIQTNLPVVILARYNPKSNQIDVLSLERCRKLKKKTSFGLEIDTVLHRSFVAHEVAHAIALRNIQPLHSTIVAQEYIAYTTQLATMPFEYQKKIIEKYETEGFRNDQEFTITFFCLNPDLFAVKAYKHFLRPENGVAFYRRILKGTFRPNEDLYLLCR